MQFLHSNISDYAKQTFLSDEEVISIKYNSYWFRENIKLESWLFNRTTEFHFMLMKLGHSNHENVCVLGTKKLRTGPALRSWPVVSRNRSRAPLSHGCRVNWQGWKHSTQCAILPHVKVSGMFSFTLTTRLAFGAKVAD